MAIASQGYNGRHTAVGTHLRVAELLRPPAWHADAACREHPGVNFFVEHGESPGPAKAICAGCLVAPECLAYALRHDEDHGVWRGTSPTARYPITRRSGAVSGYHRRSAPCPAKPSHVSRASRRRRPVSGVCQLFGDGRSPEPLPPRAHRERLALGRRRREGVWAGVTKVARCSSRASTTCGWPVRASTHRPPVDRDVPFGGCWWHSASLTVLPGTFWRRRARSGGSHGRTLVRSRSSGRRCWTGRP